MARLVTSRRQSASEAAHARAAAAPPHVIKLSVAHGDMRLAKYPLAVGHYHGDTIVHAERRLDLLLDGRLTDLLSMYLYPGPRGTVELIYAPGSHPPGALVIGLGDVGEIESSVVSGGVASAALRNALAVLDRARRERRPAPAADTAAPAERPRWVAAGFSSLLLGTYGAGALSVDDSVAAIVRGALQANRVLRARGLWDRVRIEEVQIVELYEDVANEALKAAEKLALRTPSTLTEGDGLSLDPPYLYPREGYSNQPPVKSAGKWWRRIQITCDEEKGDGDGFRFVALTDRARAEDTRQYAQRDSIKDEVDKAVRARTFDEELMTMLYMLLVPNAIKDLFISESNLVLVLDRASAQYPWEMLAEPTRDGVVPFAVRMGMIRQFKTERFTLRPQPERELSALVIGNPKSRERDLPAARKEAQLVADLLAQNGYDVGGGALNDAESGRVMRSLCARGYKILHIAGHGEYVPGKPDKSGVILSNGMCLSPVMIRNLNPLPELVFINCCHLGRLDDGTTQPLGIDAPHALAASIAEELIDMGVKAVVAAGWAVEDTPAAEFARVFYEEMLGGEKFGLAVKQARIAARDAALASHTWGAYQCYGNPDFVLDLSARPQLNLTPRDYLERLGYIKTDAKWADEVDRAELRLQLEELDANLPAPWRDGATLRTLGDAWAALGDFGKAITSYKAALHDEKAEAPIRVIEQLASLLLLRADQLIEEKSADGADDEAAAMPDVERLLRQAMSHLRWLLRAGPSVERYSLMGGCYKRKAIVAPTAEERVKCLRRAKEFYGKAHRLAGQQPGSLKPYPALNWLTYRFLLREALDAEFGLLDECKEAARAEEEQSASFWNRVTEADAELLRSLAKGSLEVDLDEVTALYVKAAGTGMNQRELASVTSHIDFIRKMLSCAGDGTQRVVAALAKLRSDLKSAGAAARPHSG